MPTISKNTLDSLDAFIEPLVVRQEQINLYVLLKIAKRVKETKELLPSDIHALEQLLKNGADAREINDNLARLIAVQVSEIKKAIQNVAEGVYNDAKPFYDYRRKPFIKFADNKEMQRVVKAIGDETAHTYENISKAQAFMLRDPQDPAKLIPTSAAEAYYKVIDRAVQSVQMGGQDYTSATSKALNELADSGLRAVEYEAESGREHTQRLDTAVRRNVLDGIREVNQAVQQEVGKEFGADGIALSAHENPAPDHEDIQGRIFTNENYEKMQSEQPFEDVNGIKFPAMARKIGIWNCRHFAWSVVVEGMKRGVYREQDLIDIKKRNAAGYTNSKGKRFTMYECTQVQRKYETDIRRAKEKYLIQKAAGNDEQAEKWKARVNKLQAEYEIFSNACGLKPQWQKQLVRGWGRDRP